jgi:Xaa-Pro aminopeptidase
LKQRRDRLRARLDELECDALFFTTMVGGIDSYTLVAVRYLTGFSGSNGQLIVGRDGDVLFTDPRYAEQVRREAPDIDATIYGTKVSGSGEAITAMTLIEDALGRVGGKRLGVDAQTMTLQSAKNLREKLAGVELVETSGLVEELRLIKDATEVEHLRTACSYGDIALGETLAQLQEGLTEFDVAVLLEAEMRKAGSHGLSFDTIVAFGEQAAEPHHRPRADRKLKRGDLIKFDFGGTHLGYHADMTRTVAFGEPSDEHRKIYELVRESQQAGVDAVKAGATNGSIDEACRGYLKERGYDFGHGTGHGVGLETHEAPGVAKGGEKVLEPGMCITVEPGIYLPGDCGVRIEDSVAVTAEGCDVLTTFTKELLVV